MLCPVLVFRLSVLFQPVNDMPCDSPIWINRAGKDFPVPCGTCPPCKIRRVNEWVFRLTWEEERNALSSHFVTLTYDSLHVPISPHGFMTLRKKDFQDYMKRLRKLHANVAPDWPPIKYYAVGEYGDLNRRPHYHAIIFNVSNDKYFADAWSLNGTQIGGVFEMEILGTLGLCQRVTSRAEKCVVFRINE